MKQRMRVVDVKPICGALWWPKLKPYLKLKKKKAEGINRVTICTVVSTVSQWAREVQHSGGQNQNYAPAKATPSVVCIIPMATRVLQFLLLFAWQACRQVTCCTSKPKLETCSKLKKWLGLHA
jgi:hypothetical protein